MRTVTTTLYTYDELSETAKERARDTYRERGWANDYDFLRDDLDWLVDGQKEEAARQGITITDAAWEDRGWANFDVAVVATIDLAAFMRVHKIAAKFRALYNIAIGRNPDVDIYNACRAVKRTWSNFYGQETEIEFAGYDDPSDNVTAQAHAVEAAIDAEIEKIERALAQAMNEELAYHNSDEYIADTITANGYEFTEDGSFA